MTTKNSSGAKCDNIVNITDRMPHVASEVACLKCKHRWIAVRPKSCMLIDLECPKCGDIGFAIETGQVFESE